MKKSNIALIGFMGVGKSAVGRVLAERLGKKLVETDYLIQQKAGKSIPCIFTEEGEIAFRELEIQVIKEVAAGKNQVIACGGGAALNRINISRLKGDSVIIWLTASPGEVMNRTLRNKETRPLLKGLNNIADIQLLLCSRKPFYEQAADLVINTTRLKIDSVVEQIIEKIKEYENNDSKKRG